MTLTRSWTSSVPATPSRKSSSQMEYRISLANTVVSLLKVAHPDRNSGPLPAKGILIELTLVQISQYTSYPATSFSHCCLHSPNLHISKPRLLRRCEARNFCRAILSSFLIGSTGWSVVDSNHFKGWRPSESGHINPPLSARPSISWHFATPNRLKKSDASGKMQLSSANLATCSSPDPSWVLRHPQNKDPKSNDSILVIHQKSTLDFLPQQVWYNAFGK